MPPFTQVKSLQTLCFDDLSNILFRLCFNLNASNESIDRVIAAFTHFLPKPMIACVCEKLLKLCDESINRVWIGSIYIKLSEGLSSPYLIVADWNSIKHFIGHCNGKNVKYIKLRGYCYTVQRFASINFNESDESYYEFSEMYKFIETLTNLTSLKCSQMCNNIMLSALATNCPHLEEISIELCSQVDNIGIAYLCGRDKVFKKGNSSFCKNPATKSLCTSKLKRISLEYTMVTNSSAFMLLQSCPNLEVVDISPDINYGEVFNMLHGTNTEKIGSIQRKYSLTVLHSNIVLDYSELDLIASTCPLLNDVTLTCAGSERRDKNLLANLIKLPLIKLKIINCDSDALLWLLNKMGPSLFDLSIQHLVCASTNVHFSRSHLQNIIKICPNLKTFNLDFAINHFISPDVPYSSFGSDKLFFTSLSTLSIEGAILLEDDLVVFLNNSSNLKDLRISTSQTLEAFNDPFLYGILANGMFKQLEQLYLYKPLLTLAGLRRLLSNCPKLRSVGPLESWVIAKAERDNLDSLIKINNWDLDFKVNDSY